MAKTENSTPTSERKAARSIVMLPVSEVRPYEKNPRKNAEAVKYVRASIEKFGFKQPIVVDSNRVIIAGHTRLEAAKSLGMDEVPCIVADDLTEAQAKALRLADNKVAEFSEWEMNLLGGELGELADISDIDMGDFGFDLSEFDNIGLNDEDTEVVEDEVPEEVEPVCKKGEIWQLGEHRLMCGDSTSADDVARLMNGERADLVFTDPPYGMNLDTDYSSMQGFGQGGKYDAGHVDDFTPDMVQAVLDLNAKETFIWGADYFAELIPNRNDGSFIVWDKRANDGGTIEQDESSDKMFGSCFELCWSKAKHKRDIARVKWAGMFGMNQTTDAKRVHPTQKPIALVAWFLNRYGKEGDIVADIFGGSGSTMIACEQLGRKCFMMELDPHYCDVIIARWEKLTGEKAVKVEDV